MSNKSSKENNMRLKALIDKHAKERKEIKESILKLKKEKKYAEIYAACKALDKLPKMSCPVRYRNRCMLTHRASGLVLFKHFGMTSYQIREKASKRCIPGIYKI